VPIRTLPIWVWEESVSTSVNLLKGIFRADLSSGTFLQLANSQLLVRRFVERDGSCDPSLIRSAPRFNRAHPALVLVPIQAL
jgi:hypothetical protein